MRYFAEAVTQSAVIDSVSWLALGIERQDNHRETHPNKAIQLNPCRRIREHYFLCDTCCQVLAIRGDGERSASVQRGDRPGLFEAGLNECSREACDFLGTYEVLSLGFTVGTAIVFGVKHTSKFLARMMGAVCPCLRLTVTHACPYLRPTHCSPPRNATVLHFWRMWKP